MATTAPKPSPSPSALAAFPSSLPPLLSALAAISVLGGIAATVPGCPPGSGRFRFRGAGVTVSLPITGPARTRPARPLRPYPSPPGGA